MSIRHNRRAFLQLSAGAALAAASGCTSHAPGVPSAAKQNPPSMPNFVILFTDDQGYGDLGCFGSRDIRTPRLDRMAAEGVKLTDFYSQPLCTPARAALLTGCYPPRVGYGEGVEFPHSHTGLNPDEITIARLLKGSGYATACIGKWHLGDAPKFLPTRQGFDTYFGLPYSNDMEPLALIRGEQTVEGPVDQDSLTQRYTEEAIRFITANKDRPFLLYLPYAMPHVPLHASAKFRGKSARGLYGDVIEEIDASAGEILDTLKRLGLDEQTLVIFTSDNGPWTEKGTAGGSSGPLREGKFTIFEGGVREPCIMRWPGRLPAGQTCPEVAATIDLLPTFAALAGAALPRHREIDGKNLFPLLTGHVAQSPHDLFCYFNGKRLGAVRRGRWKLFLGRGTGETHDGKKDDTALYDLQADIGETRNVAGDHPDIVSELKSAAEKFDAEFSRSRRPVGHV
ncbi:MAG: arylsulfatase [Phycisphaerales bacterium]|nr:arylsulfatase [Phycisphaerales bacterium]